MGGEKRTFIGGPLSLHHVDVFKRQVFHHFIFSINRLGSQLNIRNIILAQKEIDAEKESFSRELIARDIVYPSQGGLLETMARRWIEDITAVAGNRIFERLHVVRARFLTAVELQYGYSTFQDAVVVLAFFSIFYSNILIGIKHICDHIFRKDDLSL